MRNVEILAARIAHTTAPRLWAFAYPTYGRGLAPLRLLAFRAWCWLLRSRIRRELL